MKIPWEALDGETRKIPEEIGLQRGLALSPFRFLVIMDALISKFEVTVFFDMLFAENLAIVDRDPCKLIEWHEIGIRTIWFQDQ